MSDVVNKIEARQTEIAEWYTELVQTAKEIGEVSDDTPEDIKRFFGLSKEQMVALRKHGAEIVIAEYKGVSDALAIVKGASL